MINIVLLDSGPLGLVTNPRATPENQECNEWLVGLLEKGIRVYVPEIADYEVRRELMRANKDAGVKRLDDLKTAIGYVPLTTDTMLKAAALWAQVRQAHQPTADDKALDGDVILAAQAAMLDSPEQTTVIATTNVEHLSRIANALEWREVV